MAYSAKKSVRPEKGEPLGDPLLDLGAAAMKFYKWAQENADPRFVGESDNPFVCMWANLQAQYNEAPFDFRAQLYTKLESSTNALGFSPIGRKRLEGAAATFDNQEEDELEQFDKE